jgi:ankyrin repeat protein
MKSVINLVFENNPEALQHALERGAKVDEPDHDGRTALIHAAIDNKLQLAKLLLNSGAEIDAQDNLGNSALHYAAQEQHLDMASLLVSEHATIDIQDAHGNTPLWRAVFNSRGSGKLITLLLKAGADRNHRNKQGKTPLDLAKTIANYDVARFFN